MKIVKAVEYDKEKELHKYPDHTLIRNVELSESAIQASLSTTCVYNVLRNEVPWWTITNRIVNNFHKARFDPVYYCKRCRWIENGGHRLAAAKKLKITVDVVTHNGCEYRRSMFGHRKNWKPTWECKEMKIDIHIPTRKREEMLNRLLVSVQCAMLDGVNVYVWFDTKEEMEGFRDKYNWVDLYWLHLKVLGMQFVPPLFWNARLRETRADVFLYLCDDTEMDIGCLRAVRNAFRNKFPDFDGVVGIRQSNIPVSQSVPAAFGAIGMKFADRFSLRNVFCPEFFCFYIDEELGIYADNIGKFYHCFDAAVIHHTPGADKAKPDDTNRWLRRNKQHDIAVYRERKRRGLIWGKNFKLVSVGE